MRKAPTNAASSPSSPTDDARFHYTKTPKQHKDYKKLEDKFNETRSLKFHVKGLELESGE